jgi:hypothetical protein
MTFVDLSSTELSIIVPETLKRAFNQHNFYIAQDQSLSFKCPSCGSMYACLDLVKTTLFPFHALYQEALYWGHKDLQYSWESQIVSQWNPEKGSFVFYGNNFQEPCVLSFKQLSQMFDTCSDLTLQLDIMQFSLRFYSILEDMQIPLALHDIKYHKEFGSQVPIGHYLERGVEGLAFTCNCGDTYVFVDGHLKVIEW